jgi:hypothetical protein
MSLERIEIDLADLKDHDQIELHTFGGKNEKTALFVVNAINVQEDKTLALGWGGDLNYVHAFTDELGPLTVWRWTGREDEESLAEAVGFLSTHPALEHCHPNDLLQAVLAVAQEANDAAPDDLPQG